MTGRTPAAPYRPPPNPRGIPHLLVPEKRKVSHWNDRHELRVNNWLEPWDFESPLDVGIITVPFSKTSILPNGAYAAPNALRDAWAIFTTFSPDYDVDISTLRVRELGDVGTPVLDLRQGIDDIQESLQACMSQPEEFFPVIIGGDHAITAPAVRAYCGAHPDQQVGLIHFDAHNDVRVMDHGPTNGTPIRGILESGVRVSGENLVQVGIHGFMNASYYKRWVEGQGGTIYTARAIRKRGMEETIASALEIAGHGTDAIYVTVDIDVLEVGYAPGTAAATADGIPPTDLLEALFILGQDPRVAAIDFVELDPNRDVAEITTRTFASAILTFLAGLFLRLNDGWRGYDPSPIRE
ncbi:MAG TPA: agmatinase family protein [Gemmatimonadales bacterium]|nr:agmatinase family protein [Gemmatimonadales bacterium]